MSQSSTPARPLRVGSRGSPLALVQARQAQAALAKACGIGPERIEIKIIRTSGDRIQDRPLADAGGKGLFTKEIEEALLSGAIDFAVHSSKDIPAVLPAGLTLAAFLPREDPRDALVSRVAKSLGELPRNALVGTSSPRRQALLMRARPDLRIASLRGNVETRLRKIEASEMDAAILAVAGLKRLGLFSAPATALEVEEFLPRRDRAPSPSKRAPVTRAPARMPPPSTMPTPTLRSPPNAPFSARWAARAAHRLPVMRALMAIR